MSLRTQKGVSAREMSLSIGQSESYIHSIESGKALPSMSAFFFICDYLNVTPAEFFEKKDKNPEKLRSVVRDLEKLSQKHFDSIAEIANALTKI